MRVMGIDPGTGSFDFFGVDGEKIILDTTAPSSQVAENPSILINTVRSFLPLDMIVGPSGYGLPVTHIKDITEKELNLMVPADKSVIFHEHIRNFILQMKEENFPVYFTPGVIHLPTVPRYRKANKIDMGTADKVCCVALAMRDQVQRYNIDYSETSFILVEAGYGFNAIIGVDHGKIVDAIGGTSGGPGFITAGTIDFELTVRTRNALARATFSGGAKDISGKDDLTPEELAEEPDRYPESWNMLLESIVKGVAAIKVTVERPREILLSGRLSRISKIAETLSVKLSKFGVVRNVERKATVAKEAAEGACIIGQGLLGEDKYKGIVDCLELRGSGGTMFDYILVKGTEFVT